MKQSNKGFCLFVLSKICVAKLTVNCKKENFAEKKMWFFFSVILHWLLL